MFRKLAEPIKNPEQDMIGICQTCKRELECKRKETQMRAVAFELECPAIECPWCKGCILLTVKT